MCYVVQFTECCPSCDDHAAKLPVTKLHMAMNNDLNSSLLTRGLQILAQVDPEADSRTCYGHSLYAIKTRHSPESVNLTRRNSRTSSTYMGLATHSNAVLEIWIARKGIPA